MKPKVSSHLNVGTAVISTTDADAQRTLNHKMAKRRRQPNHQLRTRPLPRLSRAGLSKYRLNISTIIRVRDRGLRMPFVDFCCFLFVPYNVWTLLAHTCCNSSVTVSAELNCEALLHQC